MRPYPSSGKDGAGFNSMGKLEESRRIDLFTKVMVEGGGWVCPKCKWLAVVGKGKKMREQDQFFDFDFLRILVRACKNKT